MPPRSQKSAPVAENPFESVERWEQRLTSESLLPAGDHVVTIVEAEGDTASTGNPQIVMRLEAPAGYLRHYETYHDQHLSKVAALYDCADVQVPQVGEFDPGDRMRISDKAIARLVGRKVGVVVRMEPDQNDSSKEWPRVAGYVEPARVTGEPDTRGLPSSGGGFSSGSSVTSDDEIPF